MSAAVEPWQVVGMRGDTDQFTKAPWRHLRVAVERDDVPGAAREDGLRSQVHEARVQAAGQGGHQLLQLAALAFPADPALLAVAEPPFAVQHQETRRVGQLRGIPLVQLLDFPGDAGKQRPVGFELRRFGVDPVGQERKLGMPLRVGQVVQMQAVRQVGGGRFRWSTGPGSPP